MSKSHRSLCASFSRTGARLCIYHLLVWSNLNFLHNSLCITSPTQSCLVLYSFCANLLDSLIKWLVVSSLPPHSLHLLFCCVLSILALIWLGLMALFCAAIRRDSIIIIIIIIIPLRVFPTNVSLWFSTGVWVIASILKSPGLSSVFCPILIMLQSGWSPLVLLFPSLLISLSILSELFQVHKLQMVSPSASSSIVYLIPYQNLGTYLALHF